MAKSAVVRAYPLVRPAVVSLVRQASVQAAMRLRLVLCLCRRGAFFPRWCCGRLRARASKPGAVVAGPARARPAQEGGRPGDGECLPDVVGLREYGTVPSGETLKRGDNVAPTRAWLWDGKSIPHIVPSCACWDRASSGVGHGMSSGRALSAR